MKDVNCRPRSKRELVLWFNLKGAGSGTQSTYWMTPGTALKAEMIPEDRKHGPCSLRLGDEGTEESTKGSGNDRNAPQLGGGGGGHTT